jgi:hypothetical protein
MSSGYNQILVASEDPHRTCFYTRYGSYEVLVVLFGLAGAPPIFQSVINEILLTYSDKFCFVCLYYILIYSRDEKKTSGTHLPCLIKLARASPLCKYEQVQIPLF